jgi:hypothetical protein
MTPTLGEHFCLSCGRPLSVMADRCRDCRSLLPRRRDRGVWAQLAGTVALGLLPFSAYFFTFKGGLKVASAEEWATAGTAYMAGMAVCVGGVIVAFLDLKGMQAGRVNPDRYTRTLVGGWMNGFTVLLYWCVIGYCIFSVL